MNCELFKISIGSKFVRSNRMIATSHVWTDEDSNKRVHKRGRGESEREINLEKVGMRKRRRRRRRRGAK